ncbi:MAG: ABC transporter permease [Vallitalea sp.]|jgi:ABC-type transport system involved in multi-copper enzyme maturation permease subunit/ribosomal protein S20|nr:ABC transporter permease [Vallitalea sp.]
MGKLIKHEMTKIIKSKKNKILILIFILLIVVSNIFYNIKYNKYIDEIEENGKISYNSAQIRGNKIIGDIHRLTKIEDELDEMLLIKEYGSLEEAQKQIPIQEKKKERNDTESSLVNIILKKEKSLEKRQKKARKDKQIQDEQKMIDQLLKYKVDRLDNIIEAEKEGVLPKTALRLRNVTINDIRRKNTYYKYLLKNNLKYSLNPYTNSGVFGIIGLFENTIILLIFLIFTFITMDLFLSEIEGGSYKLAYTQPYERSKIFFSKVMAMLIFTIVVILAALSLNFIANSIISEIGNFSEPVAVSENIKNISLNNKEVNYIIISIGAKILLSILLFLTIIMFNISLISTISVFTDSTTKTMGIVISAIMLCLLIRRFVSPGSIIHGILPYSYIFNQDILIGRYNTSYILGVLINLGLSAVLLLIGSKKIAKKDFLGARD